MSLTMLLNRPVTIVQRFNSGQTDDYGNEVKTMTAVETVGELQQKSRAEQGTQGELSDTEWLLFLPAGTVIDTGDEVWVDGEAFEMVGDPWHARNPRTHAEQHVEASLRRTHAEEDGS